MIYLNCVGQQLFYYNSPPCLCATEIRAFISFPECEGEIVPDGHSTALCSHGTNHCLSSVASAVCAVFVIFCLNFIEIESITLSKDISQRSSETPVVRSGKRGKLSPKQRASGFATHCVQKQQQISIHEYISSGHYCAVMKPGALASFQPPVTYQYLTLMKNAACFDHHNITTSRCL